MRRNTLRRAIAGVTTTLLTAALFTGLSEPARAAVPVAGTSYTVSVTVSGKCLDITGGSKDNAALLQQWSCSGDAWQQFTLTAAGSGIYTLVNVNSGRCLDVPSGSTASGVRIQQWGCANSANQQWRLTVTS